MANFTISLKTAFDLRECLHWARSTHSHLTTVGSLFYSSEVWVVQASAISHDILHQRTMLALSSARSATPQFMRAGRKLLWQTLSVTLASIPMRLFQIWPRTTSRNLP